MIEPSIKQKDTFKKVLENRGNISQAMKDAGYSDAYSKNPQQLTATDSWKKLMEEYFPDKDLAKVGKEGLNSTRVISAINTNKEATGGTTDFVEVPDYSTRHKYWETTLKLKKRLTDRLDVTSGDKPLPILGGITNGLHSNNSNKETLTTK